MNLKWAVISLIGLSDGIRVTIPYRMNECIKVTGVPSSRTMISHEVLSPADGKVAVGVMQFLKDNKTHVLPVGGLVHSGSFDLTEYVKVPTTFQICFHAAEQLKTGYEIMFAIDSDPKEQELNLATVQHTEGLLKALRAVEETATDLYRSQYFKTSRWNSYNQELIRSHRRLKIWRIIQSLGVGAFVFTQIFFVRHVFNKKTHLLG